MSVVPSLGSSADACSRAMLGLLVALACSACEEGSDRTKTVRDRNDAVVATASTTSTKAAPTATVSAAKKPPRGLCAAKPKGRPSDARIDTAIAPGAMPPRTPVPFGAGKWIWVNLWAAWCGPCKEEMPRLHRWQAELRKSGVLVDLAFVAMDDDERQLQRFLASQPETGLRATYWLKDEAAREKWLGPFGIPVEATLPVHALVSPKGDLACVIEGAVEDEDFPRIASLLKGG
jgi:thiol-disulfide isomerase/thioredoxin